MLKLVFKKLRYLFRYFCKVIIICNPKSDNDQNEWHYFDSSDENSPPPPEIHCELCTFENNKCLCHHCNFCNNSSK